MHAHEFNYSKLSIIKPRKRIVIDLTAILPDGINGGAKIFSLELVSSLVKKAFYHEFILLTTPDNYNELAFLEGPNVTRKNILKLNKIHFTSNKIFNLSIKFFIKFFKPFLAKYKKNLLKQLKTDLLFCPFTSMAYATSSVPTIAIIYDLQHRHYPQFFSIAERCERDFNLVETIHKATKLICISDFTKRSILSEFNECHNKLQTIYITLAQRFDASSEDISANILSKFNLQENNYLLYPANFWQHKNHEILFLAFSKYCQQFKDSTIKLVCTGSPNNRMEFLKKFVSQMKLTNSIIFTGYVANHELIALMKKSLALIFPSLYEGYGMPIAEAMVLGKPILCSNMTSLPEIGHDAVLYFDPRKPEQITQTILTIISNEKIRQELITKGKKYAKKFTDTDRMTEEYIELINSVLAH